jgi:biotin carboxyl carrier protein
MKNYRITIKGREYDVVVGDLGANPVSVTVDGVEYHVEIPGKASAPVPQPPRAATPARTATPAAPRPSAPVSGNDSTVRAMMPGRIISVSVRVGDKVTAGQAVLVMESMKMENTITAPKAGTVTAIAVSAGDSVQHGQTMIEIES